jgi:hypothetical protein
VSLIVLDRMELQQRTGVDADGDGGGEGEMTHHDVRTDSFDLLLGKQTYQQEKN